MLNRVDLSSRRNDISDGMVLTDDGRAFQASVAVVVVVVVVATLLSDED